MLALNNVDAGYGGFQALFDVSLEVNAGEAVAVIGPNGAGKTTLMRVISGLIPAKKGTITMQGVSVLDAPPHDIVSMGVAHVPENRRLFARRPRSGPQSSRSAPQSTPMARPGRDTKRFIRL